jgi:predicted GNAT family N-acyltransferase
VAGNLYFRRYDSREDFYLSHQRCIYENLDHIDLSPELKKVTLIVQF